MTNKIIGAIVIGTGAVLTTAVGYLGCKLRKLANNVGMSVSEMEEASKKDIQEAMIEKAVKNAAEIKTEHYIHMAGNRVTKEALDTIQTEVRKSVDEAKVKVESQVEGRITEQVANLDIDSLKKTVRERAEKKVIEKFDGKLDDILKDFSDNLDRVKKIYTSIADTLTPKDSGKEISFKVG